MTKYGRIYIIRNTINTKVYVGQATVSIKLRFQNHLSAARRGKDYIIGKAIRKYGEGNFYAELLEECLAEELNDREIFWISHFNSTNNGVNLVRTTKELNPLFVLSEFDSGKSAMTIAKELHIHPYKVAEVLQRYNRVYGVDKQRTPKSIEKEILELYKE